jgi:hypothetical protein
LAELLDVTDKITARRFDIQQRGPPQRLADVSTHPLPMS